MQTITRGCAALSGLLVSAAILTGCAATNNAAAPTASVTPTPTAAAAADDSLAPDTSMSAACGQLSALSTVQENAQADQADGTISADEYRALLNAVSFGIQQIPPIWEPSNSIGSAKAYLASLEDGAFDPTDPQWGALAEKLAQDCRAAGSPIGVSLTHGG